jgi:hypothetical protein
METNSIDGTQNIRRALSLAINAQPTERAILEARHGRVWSASELSNDFEVLGFAAPFVVVKLKADHQLGSLMFQHRPRYYFGFKENK